MNKFAYSVGRYAGIQKRAAGMPNWYGSETTAYHPTGEDIPKDIDPMSLPYGVYHSMPVSKKPRGMLGRLFGGGQSFTEGEVPEALEALKGVEGLDVGPVWDDMLEFGHKGGLKPEMQAAINAIIAKIIAKRKEKPKKKDKKKDKKKGKSEKE